MGSKYGTIKITDEELRFLITTLTARRHALGRELKHIRDHGQFVGDPEYDNVVLALQKARTLSIKLQTLRENAKLT